MDPGAFKKSVNEFTEPLKLSVFFTSIKNGGNFDLLNNFYFLFEEFFHPC